MKFQNVTAFQKHLNEAFPRHLSRVYLIACPFDSDRKKLIELTTDLFLQTDVQLCLFEVGTVPLDEVFEQLNTKSLFGKEMVVVFDGIEKLKNKALEQLADYLTSPSPFAYLILGAASLKQSADLYQKAKKEVVILDLTDEKPWDRQKRVELWVTSCAQKEGKKMGADAAALLVERIGPDMMALHQELVKLVCYVGSRSVIEKQDVLALASHNELEMSWQSVERIIWDEQMRKELHGEDISSILAIVTQMRNQLEIGLQMASLLKQGKDTQAIAGYFPQLKPARLQKYLPIVARRGADFFHRGLMHLFELELACKSQSVPAVLLFDHFLIKLNQMK